MKHELETYHDGAAPAAPSLTQERQALEERKDQLLQRCRSLHENSMRIYADIHSKNKELRKVKFPWKYALFPTNPSLEELRAAFRAAEPLEAEIEALREVRDCSDRLRAKAWEEVKEINLQLLKIARGLDLQNSAQLPAHAFPGEVCRFMLSRSHPWQSD